MEDGGLEFFEGHGSGEGECDAEVCLDGLDGLVIFDFVEDLEGTVKRGDGVVVVIDVPVCHADEVECLCDHDGGEIF